MCRRFFVLLFIAGAALASPFDTQRAAKDWVIKQKGVNSKAVLTTHETSTGVFRQATILTVRNVGSTTQSWQVWIDKQGKIGELQTKRGLRPFLQSMQAPLASLELGLDDKKRTEQICATLLNYLSTARKSIDCRTVKKNQFDCEIGFTEGELVAEKAVLSFDTAKGSAQLK